MRMGIYGRESCGDAYRETVRGDQEVRAREVPVVLSSAAGEERAGVVSFFRMGRTLFLRVPGEAREGMSGYGEHA